jgi:PAS domain S-box-containing protein
MQSVSAGLARSVLDAAPDAMIVVDRSGTICLANRQASALFGHPHDAIVGTNVEFLLPPRFRARHLEHREGYMGNLRVRPMGAGLELFGLRRDGSEFPVEISLSPVDDGQQLVAAAIRDVTDRKRVEAELILARRSAEQARAAADSARQAADVARESADRANQAKGRFLATASHDLRQPLQTLSLLNGVLRRAIGEPVAVEALAQQDQAISAMSRLLNALLDISKLESGAVKPNPSDFAIDGLFEELRLVFTGVAASKGLKLTIEPCGESGFSDRALVEQILRNLLSNAIKYTREGHVTVRCQRHGAGWLRLEVEDTGIGIAADQLRLIYDEFYQVGVPANSSREGYGLGLSIVRRLVSLLGATLEVRSEVDKGSLFALVLPAGHGMRGHGDGPAHRAAGARPTIAHVLLVEDDAAVRNATKLLLRSEGYVVQTAESLAEALQRAQEMRQLDLLLTDYHLGQGESGLEVLSAVRERLGRRVKAVLITGDTSAAVRDLRADSQLRVASKPIQAEELLEMLRELMRA